MPVTIIDERDRREVRAGDLLRLCERGASAFFSFPDDPSVVAVLGGMNREGTIDYHVISGFPHGTRAGRGGFLDPNQRVVQIAEVTVILGRALGADDWRPSSGSDSDEQASKPRWKQIRPAVTVSRSEDDESGA